LQGERVKGIETRLQPIETLTNTAPQRKMWPWGMAPLPFRKSGSKLKRGKLHSLRNSRNAFSLRHEKFSEVSVAALNRRSRPDLPDRY
jgi:hypothetical protein